MAAAAHRIHLLRHAKSSWNHAGLPDHERPLAARGHRACAALSEHIRRSSIAPDLVLCSSAVRARETLEGILAALPDGAEVVIDDELYGAATSTLLDRLRTLDEDTDAVLLIGHNPAIGSLASALAGGGDPAALASLGTKYPTGALATLTHTGTWQELDRAVAVLDAFVTPQHLPPGR